MNQDARIVADPAPAITLGELGDNAVHFNVGPSVKSADCWPVGADMPEKVKPAFDANGIGIPCPQRDVHIHNAA